MLGALPLRSLSQLWGYLNGLVLPVWFRPYGFRLYSYIFGCDLSEVPQDLASYESLGDFFYRQLREGARPISDAAMVSYIVHSVFGGKADLAGLTSRWPCPPLW